jgi:hypothetical protein
VWERRTLRGATPRLEFAETVNDRPARADDADLKTTLT